jgi:dipeptidyl aminopeptidase/acylaminoacyl peptidase
VPESQARVMIAALKSQGKTCDSLFFPDEDHSISKEKNRLKEYRTIEAFLKRYLPPDLP